MIGVAVVVFCGNGRVLADLPDVLHTSFLQVCKRESAAFAGACFPLNPLWQERYLKPTTETPHPGQARPDQTRPDETRPGQTRPDQTPSQPGREGGTQGRGVGTATQTALYQPARRQPTPQTAQEREKRYQQYRCK